MSVLFGQLTLFNSLRDLADNGEMDLHFDADDLRELDRAFPELKSASLEMY